MNLSSHPSTPQAVADVLFRGRRPQSSSAFIHLHHDRKSGQPDVRAVAKLVEMKCPSVSAVQAHPERNQ
jgi:hypothetical protein